MSGFFKSKKKAIKAADAVKAPEPRDIKAITDEHNRTALQAGVVQYQLKVYQSQLDQLNNQLLALNNEGAARQKMDNEAKQKEKEATNG